MYEDFRELQARGLPPDAIIQTLAEKYKYDLPSAIASGKTKQDILADLILAKPKSESVLGATLTGFQRGVLEDVPTLLGKALKAPGTLLSPLTGTTALPVLTPLGEAIESFGERAKKYYETAYPEYEGLAGLFHGATRMLAPSIGLTGLAGMAGAGIGRLLGIKEAEKLLKIGTATAPVPFGLAEFQKAMEEQKDTEDKIVPFIGAIARGAIEYGGEYLGTKYLARLFGLDEAHIPKNFKEWVGQLIKTIKVEAFTEAGQEASEQLIGDIVNQYLKKEDRNLYEIVGRAVKAGLEVMPETTLMTIMTAGLGKVYGRKPRPVEEEKPTEEVKPPPQPPPTATPTYDTYEQDLIRAFGGEPTARTAPPAQAIPITPDVDLLMNVFGGAEPEVAGRVVERKRALPVLPFTPEDTLVRNLFAGVTPMPPSSGVANVPAVTPPTTPTAPVDELTVARNILSLFGGSTDKLMEDINNILAERPALKSGMAIPVMPTTEESIEARKGRIPNKARDVINTFVITLNTNKTTMPDTEALAQTITHMNRTFPDQDWMGVIKDFSSHVEKVIERGTAIEKERKRLTSPEVIAEAQKYIAEIDRLAKETDDLKTFSDAHFELMRELSKKSKDVAKAVTNHFKNLLGTDVVMPNQLWEALRRVVPEELATVINDLAGKTEALKLEDFKKEFTALSPHLRQALLTNLGAKGIEDIYSKLQDVNYANKLRAITDPGEMVKTYRGIKDEFTSKTDELNKLLSKKTKYTANEQQRIAQLQKDVARLGFAQNLLATNYLQATGKNIEDAVVEETKKLVPPSEEENKKRINEIIDDYIDNYNEAIDAIAELKEIEAIPEKELEETDRQYKNAVRQELERIKGWIKKNKDEYKELTGRDLEKDIANYVEEYEESGKKYIRRKEVKEGEEGEKSKEEEIKEILGNYVGDYNEIVNIIDEYKELQTKKKLTEDQQKRKDELKNALTVLHKSIAESVKRYKELTGKDLEKDIYNYAEEVNENGKTYLRFKEEGTPPKGKGGGKGGKGTGTGTEPTDTGTGGGKGGRGRQDIRVVNEKDIPKPKNFIPSNKYKLLDKHQRLGVNLALHNYFENKNKGFMLADGTGIGKTMEILAIAKEIADRSDKPALIVTDSKTVIDTAFRVDAQKLGIKLDNIILATYVDIRGKVDKKTGKTERSPLLDKQYSVVVFDEAQNLKNVESKQFKEAENIKADYRVFATATPMDKIQGATYFMATLHNIPLEKLMDDLGYTIVEKESKSGEIYYVAKLTEKANSWEEVLDALLRYRDKAIKEGKMIRREYPFYGDIEFKHLKLSDTQVEEQRTIDRYWEEEITRKPDKKYTLAGNRIQELSRWTETQKTKAVIQELEKDLAEGKSVIIVAERINPTKIKGLADTEIHSLLSYVATYLDSKGIPYAEIYGHGSKAGEVEKFQSNKVRVALATKDSGGVGINLDDITGKHPRVMYLASIDFSGNTFQQTIGRVSRRMTVTPALVKVFAFDNSLADARRADILNEKLDVLRAIQHGEIDLDEAIGMEITEEQPKGATARKIETIVKRVRKTATGKTVTITVNDKKVSFSLLTLEDLDRILAETSDEANKAFEEGTAEKITKLELPQIFGNLGIKDIIDSKNAHVDSFASTYSLKLDPVDTSTKERIVSTCNKNADAVLTYIKDNLLQEATKPVELKSKPEEKEKIKELNITKERAMRIIRNISALIPIAPEYQRASILDSDTRSKALAILEAIKKSDVAYSYYHVPIIGERQIKYYADLVSNILAGLNLTNERKLTKSLIVEKARIYKARLLDTIPVEHLQPLFAIIDKTKKLESLYGKKITNLVDEKKAKEIKDLIGDIVEIGKDGALIYKGDEVTTSYASNRLVSVHDLTQSLRTKLKYDKSKSTVFKTISEAIGLADTVKNTLTTTKILDEYGASFNNMIKNVKVKQELIEDVEEDYAYITNWVNSLYAGDRHYIEDKITGIADAIKNSSKFIKTVLKQASRRSDAPYLRMQSRMSSAFLIFSHTVDMNTKLRATLDKLLSKYQNMPARVREALTRYFKNITDQYSNISFEQAFSFFNTSGLFSDLPTELSNALRDTPGIDYMTARINGENYSLLLNTERLYVMLHKTSTKGLTMISLTKLMQENKEMADAINEALNESDDAFIKKMLEIKEKYASNKDVVLQKFDDALMSFGLPVEYFRPFFTGTAYEGMKTFSVGKSKEIFWIPIANEEDAKLLKDKLSNEKFKEVFEKHRSFFTVRNITMQEINAGLLEDVASKLNLSAMCREFGIPNPFVNSMNSSVDKLLSKYINRILAGFNVRVEVVDPNEFVNRIKMSGLSLADIVNALYAHGVSLKDIHERGIEELIKEKFLGATLTSDGIIPVIYINEHLSDFNKIKAGLHEIVEVFLQSGLITEKDARIVQREFTDGIRDWKENFADSLAHYIMDEEAISERHKSLLSRVYEAVRNFIARLRSLLHGDGFRTTADIFKDIMYGYDARTDENVFRRVDPIAFSLKYDSFIKTVYRVGKDIGFEDLVNSATTAMSETWKDPKMKTWMKFGLPPQWIKIPVVERVFKYILDAKEYADSIIYDTLSDFVPTLQTLKKRNRTMYENLQKAVIDSDIVNAVMPDDLLKSRYKLDDDTIRIYHDVKRVFDDMIDKIFDEYNRVLLIYSLDTVESGTIKEKVKDLLLDREKRIEFIRRFEKGKYNIADALEFFSIPKLGEKEAQEKMANELKALVDLIQPEMKELHSKVTEYKKGFYFPRIRPAGKYSISVWEHIESEDKKGKLFIPSEMYMTEKSVSDAKERFQAELILRDIKKRFKNPLEIKDIGSMTKDELAQKAKGHDALIINDSAFVAFVKGILPEMPVVSLNETIRMPKSYYEGVSDRMINEHLLDLLHRVGDKLELTGEKKEMFKSLSAYLRDAIATDLKARQLATSRFIRRKGRGEGTIDLELLDDPKRRVTTGYFTDLEDVIKKYVIAESEHVGRLRASSTLFNFRTEEGTEKALNSDPNLYDWYKKYTRAVLSTPSYAMQVAQKAKAMVALWYLGGRISSGIVQLTQILTTAVPELATFVNAKASDLEGYTGESIPLTEMGKHVERQQKAMSLLGKAFSDIMSNNLTQDEKEALHIAIRSGATMSKFTNDLMAGFHEVTGRILAPMAKYGMFFFQFAEEKSRESGFLAGYRLALSKGLSKQDAIDFALQYTREAFHIYGTANRPLVALGDGGFNAIANVALSLKGFTMNYLGWSYNALKEQHGKRYADKVFFSIAYTMMLGGLFVIPGVGDLLDILSQILGIPIKKKMINAITKDKAIQEGLEFGILAPITKIDLSGSMKVEVLPRELSVTGIADYIFGVWTGVGTKLTRAKYAMETEQYVEAMKALSPLAVEQSIKAIEMLGGKPLKTIYGKTIVDQFGKPVEPTQFEKFLMFFGFRPVTLSDVSSVYVATRTVEEYFRRKREKINTMIKVAKPEDLPKIVKEINDFNTQAMKYKGAISPITPDSVQRVIINSKGKMSKLAPVLFD